MDLNLNFPSKFCLQNRQGLLIGLVLDAMIFSIGYLQQIFEVPLKIFKKLCEILTVKIFMSIIIVEWKIQNLTQKFEIFKTDKKMRHNKSTNVIYR